MNAFSKLVSGRLKAQPAGPHPEPEVLAAFAENALPHAERRQLLQHLGDCSDCRDVVYLAMPQSEEAQTVLSFPRRRFGFLMRYGLVGAAVAVAGAVSFVSLRKTSQLSLTKVSQPAASLPAKAKIASEKPPQELDSLTANETARARNTKNEMYAANAPKQLPPLKHMTAKPEAKLKFEDSGQVSVSSADELPKSTQQLPLEGRNATAFTSLGAGAAATAAPAPQAPAMSAKDAYTISGVPVKGDLALGNLGGIVFDRSGAVVGNAKVTTIGPAGSRTSTSDPQGRFDFTRLKPGVYSVTAQARGFKTTEVPQVQVAENKPATLQLTLDVGATSEAVEVNGAAASLETLASNADENDQVSLNRMQTAEVVAKKKKPTRAAAVSFPALRAQWTLSPEGKLQRSLDAGKSWQTLTSAPAGSFRALSAFGSDIWVGGTAGTLLHSPDSGTTWTPLQIVSDGLRLRDDISHIDFTDPLNGSVTTTGGETWTTTDGGKTWSRK